MLAMLCLLLQQQHTMSSWVLAVLAAQQPVVKRE
jgi:hypothetical protein